MAKSRRVGGSGWAGVHGSFVGLGGRSCAKSSKAKGHGLSGGLPMSLQEARQAGLSIKQWRALANRQVAKIEGKLNAAREEVKTLKEQLVLLERSRQAAYRADDGTKKVPAASPRKRLP